MDDETFLHEPVKVIAIFNGTDCRPLKFRRTSGREITIGEIGLSFPQPAGRRVLHVFDVTDGQADFRLEFDAERLIWHLTREADHAE